MSRYSISTKLRMGALALLLICGTSFAQPDPVAYGNRVESGDLGQVREWLAAGLDPDYLADRIGTGLMIAAWYGNLPMMELLVARGANVNKANALGEQALMHAAWRGQSEAIKWLLAKGAKVNSAPMRWSALHYAAFGGHGDAAKQLLDNGADINARSTNGSSVLMMAVYEGHETLVRQLLARGADRGLKNDRGEGALEWAFKHQRLAIARLVSAPQEFAAAANQPKARWGESVRSQPSAAAPTAASPEPPDPLTVQIESLLRMRDVLAARGLTEEPAKLDKRIAALRAQRARADRGKSPAAVLEISASRASPEDQRMRMIFGVGGPPP